MSCILFLSKCRIGGVLQAADRDRFDKLRDRMEKWMKEFLKAREHTEVKNDVGDQHANPNRWPKRPMAISPGEGLLLGIATSGRAILEGHQHNDDRY